MRACWTLNWCNKSRENYNSYQCLIDTYFMISAILHHTLPLRVMLSVLKTKHHRTIHDILKQQIETSNNAYINAKNQEDNTKNVFIFSFSSVKTFLCSGKTINFEQASLCWTRVTLSTEPMLRMSGRFHWGCFKMMVRTPGTITIAKLCCRVVAGSIHSLKSHTPGLKVGLIKSQMSPGGVVSWGKGTKSVWGVHIMFEELLSNASSQFCQLGCEENPKNVLMMLIPVRWCRLLTVVLLVWWLDAFPLWHYVTCQPPQNR